MNLQGSQTVMSDTLDGNGFKNHMNLQGSQTISLTIESITCLRTI